MSSSIEISRRILLINFFSATARRALSLVVLFWLYGHLIRSVSRAAEYELYPVLMSLMMFFQLGTPIFASGLKRYITEAYARGDEARVISLVSTMSPVLIGAGFLLFFVGSVFAWHIDAILTIEPDLVGDAQLMFTLLMFNAGFQLAVVPFGIGFYVRQKFLLKNVIGLGAELLRTVLLFALLRWLGTEVRWVVVAMVTASVTELAVETVVSARIAPSLRWRRGAFQRELVKPMLSFGVWAVLGRLAFLIREAADTLILHKLSTPVEVAIFHQGSLVDTHLRRTYLFAISTGQTAVTAMHATEQHWRLRRAYFVACRYSLWVMLVVAVPFIIYRHEFFMLYMKDKYSVYGAAAAVMAILLARAVIIFPNSILGMVTIATARMRSMAWRSCLVSGANLVLTIYMVGPLQMGAVGSALATLIVTVIGAPLLNWTLGLELTGAKLMPWMRNAVLPGLVPAAIAAPAWLGMSLLVPAEDWGAFAVDLAVGAAVYLAALLCIGMRPADRRDVSEVLAGLRAALNRAPRQTL